MTSTRFTCFALLLALSSPAFAQSDAQQSFGKLKALAGTWEGPVTTDPKAPEIEGKTMHVTLRVTSMGNTLMHEMTGADRPDDPITMLYVNDDQLTLTHYCDAGNRPRMVGKPSPDGQTVRFDFVDVTGSLAYGHMDGAVFTFVDDDHHSEDWIYMKPDGASVRAHVDLRRSE
jgi:hypothetical protein